jgi:anti-sigma B factor antagonist
VRPFGRAMRDFDAGEFVEGPARVLAVTGEIDAAAADAFKERLEALLANDDGPVVLDLTEATYMDSRAVAVLFAARKEAGVERGRFAVVCVGEIRRMFDFTGLDIAFDVVGSLAEAVEHVAAVA